MPASARSSIARHTWRRVSSSILLQPAISGMVRRQPSQKPLRRSMRHTEEHGEGTSCAMACTATARSASVFRLVDIHTTSATGAPVSFSRSCGRSWNTACGWPAAAQISSKRNSSRSISTTGLVTWRHGRDAADGEAGARLHEVGIGAAGLADQRIDLLLVHALVARGDDQHRHFVALAAEDDALGDLPHGDAERIGRLLRGAAGVVEHAWRMGWPASCSTRETRWTPSGREWSSEPHMDMDSNLSGTVVPGE